VKGIYEDPISAKTPENPPHCHVPLISDFTEASRYFILDVFTKKQPKIVKAISDHTKSNVLIFRNLKKY
jgi:hypothetical protein